MLLSHELVLDGTHKNKEAFTILQFVSSTPHKNFRKGSNASTGRFFFFFLSTRTLNEYPHEYNAEELFFLLCTL